MKSAAKVRKSRLHTFGGAALALSMVLAACGGEVKEPQSQNPGGDTIVIGSIGWNEDVAVHTLWKRLLETRGYTVEIRHSNPPATFAGLANDQIDVFMDAWLPSTHEEFMKQYGASLDKIGSWYTNGTLEWTVPSYVEGVDSIADLRGKAEMFNGTITGIEPKAGITTTSKNSVIPEYQLGDSYELHESTSSAMLVALEQAVATQTPIVVTLWHPHVAYTRWDLKDLEDPRNALGTGQNLWVLARSDFADDAPKVAKWLKSFQLSHEQLRSLEDLIFNKYPNNHKKAADEWISKHGDLVKKWIPKTSW